jgi:3',5'-cyclic AMP phosphodiesterase CpdA
MPPSDPATSGPLSRRHVLAATLGLAAGAGLSRASSPPADRQARRALRLAHPSDIHVQPELRGGDAMAACFRHMMALDTRPDLIITGGDLAMDIAENTYDRSKLEWDLFTRVLRDQVPSSVPIHHTLGNHDIFGRNKTKSKATGSEPHYGKRWFLDSFGYTSTFRSFDQGGWHFVILDSINLLPDGDEYVCRLGPEQFAWLEADLAATSLPTVISSHAPIICVANFFDAPDDSWFKSMPDLKVSSKRMHTDCRELEALFQKHPHVKLCLNGHLHLLATATYNGVAYISQGAVSGDKWKGFKRQTPEGYGVIDLFDDGSFHHQYMTYGWNATK